MKKMTKRNGFTIIELLVVISIMSILMTLALIGGDTVRKKSRDARRKNDLAKAQGVLTLFYSDKKSYPLPCVGNLPCFYKGDEGGYDLMMNGGKLLDNTIFAGLIGSGYTSSKIQDENCETKDGTGFCFRYRPSADGLSFELSAKLENNNDKDKTGDNTGDGADPDRYEIGTDKGIPTNDATDSTDAYCNKSGVIQSWTYDFQTSLSCGADLMKPCQME